MRSGWIGICESDLSAVKTAAIEIRLVGICQSDFSAVKAAAIEEEGIYGRENREIRK